MAEDYLKALNVGTGLDTTAIIDAMITAERTPKEKQITDRKEARTVSISSLGTVKQTVSDFDTGLDAIDGTTGLTASQSGTSVSVAITDTASAAAFSHAIEVTSLASAQTLVFDGYSAASAALGAGSLVFDFGTWSNNTFTAATGNTSTTVTIASGTDTLEEIAAQINDAGINVTASIVKKTDTNYALVLRAATGVDNAMRITATETAAGSGLADIDFTTYSSSTESVSAANASLTIDGVSVSRASNSITDLVDGVTVTLNSTTSSSETISASYDSTTAFDALNAMITDVNTLTSLLTTQSQRGLNGAEAGPLAGDPMIQGMINDLRAITTTAIPGFNDDNVYLANFGVETNRNGTLTIDQDDFDAAFVANPDSFAAIMNSRVTTGSSLVTARVLGDDYTAGVYSFELDGRGAKIGTDSMTLVDGEYVIDSGDADGLALTVTGSTSTTNVYMGISLLDSLKDFAAKILGANSDIANRITTYRTDVLDYDDQLTALDTHIDAMRERYVDQFAKMDQAVAGLKKTGEALTSMMDSWKASQSR